MQAIVAEPGSVMLVERPVPVPVEGELLVAPQAIGLCGTDLEIIDGTIDPAYVNYPLVIGHEWSGTVVESRAEGFSPGDRVVVEGIVPCRQCPACARGDTNLCATYDEYGFTRDGAAAERIAVKAFLAHKLADDVSFASGALVEPAAVVFRGLSRLNLRPGLSGAVIGDGTVALLCAHLLGLWSPASVTVIGQRPAQRELALAAGATSFELESGSAGFDVVIEAAGTVRAVETAVAACERGGSVLLLGLPPHGEVARLSIDDLVNNDQTIVASFGYTTSSWRSVVALANAGRLRPELLVTHRFAFSDFSVALETLRHGVRDEPRGKVLFGVDR